MAAPNDAATLESDPEINLNPIKSQNGPLMYPQLDLETGPISRMMPPFQPATESNHDLAKYDLNPPDI